MKRHSTFPVSTGPVRRSPRRGARWGAGLVVLLGLVALLVPASATATTATGTVVAWGTNFFGQATVPAGLSGVTAVAAGDLHSLAVKSDGTVVAWGNNGAGQATVPAGLSGVTAVAAGDYHSLALIGAVDTTAPVVTCDTPAPLFALNASPAEVTGTLVDETDPTSQALAEAADTTSITNSRTVALSGTDTAGNPSNTADCGYTVAAGFGGYRSPLPRTTYAKSASSIPVKFTLTDTNGPLSPTASADLAAHNQVRAALTGPGLTTPRTALCSWNAVAGNFACTIKTIKSLQANNPYQVTVQEKGTGNSDTFFTVPGASSTSIFFK